MDRFDIILNKEPPKLKIPIEQLKLTKKLYLGERRSGKTSALLNEIINILTKYRSPKILYCSPIIAASQNTVENFFISIYRRGHLFGDLRQKIKPCSWNKLQFKWHFCTAVCLDDIDFYKENVSNILTIATRFNVPVFATSSYFNFSYISWDIQYL